MKNIIFFLYFNKKNDKNPGILPQTYTPKHPPVQFSHTQNNSRPTGVLNPDLTAP